MTAGSAPEVSRLSSVTRAADAAGVTVGEYRRRLADGQKWCRAHSDWHPFTDFGTDTKGEGGRARSCRAARRMGSDPEQQDESAAGPAAGRARPHYEVPILPAKVDTGPAIRDVASSRTVDWSAAACRDEDPELFFPVGTTGPARRQTADAAAVCARCPIRQGCLDVAIARGEEFGVFGGLTRGQRERVGRRRAS